MLRSRMRFTLRLSTILLIPIVLSGCGFIEAHRAQVPKKALTPADIAIGMSAADFLRIYPAAKISSNGQWELPGEIGGLRGTWIYSFNRRKLSWYIFNSYEPDVNKVTFVEYLDATKKAITAFNATYGQPDSTSRGLTEFKDPQAGFGGYPVISASWLKGRENVRIDYSVLAGGVGRAQLLFTVEYRWASSLAG